MQSKYVLFLDLIGRLIIGKNDGETDDIVKVKNPLIIHAETDGQGKLSIQFFPIILREFLASKNDPTVWAFYKKNITISDNAMLDLRLISQYEKIFEPIVNVMPIQQSNMPPQSQPTQMAPPNANVIKLFDD